MTKETQIKLGKHWLTLSPENKERHSGYKAHYERWKDEIDGKKEVKEVKEVKKVK